MRDFSLHAIGTVSVTGDEMTIQLDPQYRPALEGLDDFGDVQVLWWFDGCDTPTSRNQLTVQAPYTHGPQTLGTFATRSPERPNPIAVTVCHITYIDHANGVIGLAYIDANDGTPVLDLKPYTPSLDRVEDPIVPDWCKHWPNSTETSGDFDWSQEFQF